MWGLSCEPWLGWESWEAVSNLWPACPQACPSSPQGEPGILVASSVGVCSACGMSSLDWLTYLQRAITAVRNIGFFETWDIC